MVGRALAAALERDGVEVRRLVRRPGAARGGAIFWDPEAGAIDAGGLEGVAGVVHLAGESVADGRWTARKKARIEASRVKGTRLLAQTLAGLEAKPEVLVSASAVGFYGLRGDEALTEAAAPGEGFLAEVCRAWEAATAPAEAAGIRVVRARLGVVLAKEGGALEKMRLPFKLGVGGRVGDGRQFMSWISLADLVCALRRALDDPRLEGPVNLVAPEPVTHAELARALGAALHRPAVLPVPAFAAKAVFGAEKAEEMLLGGQRVVPAKLKAAGFDFRHPSLDSALAYTEG
jgi:uncharacterized protein (TIGR01777 family)